jgi:WD40 repeat protein
MDLRGEVLLAHGAENLAHGVNLATGEVFELPTGDSEFSGLQVAPDGSSMLVSLFDGSVRVWRTSDRKLLRTVMEHKGQVGEVDYVDTHTIASVGADGKLLTWSPDGTDVALLFQAPTPLISLEVLATNRHIVVADRHGAVWDVATNRMVSQVRIADSVSTVVLRASRDGKLLAVGIETGAVTIYDTASWRVLRTLQFEGRIRQIRFDPRNRDILIASMPRTGQLGSVHLVSLDHSRVCHWTDVPAAVRDVQYAADGDTIGFVDTDGGTWLYSMSRDQWVYANDERTDTLVGMFSEDGRRFVSVNRRGALIVRDVVASFRADQEHESRCSR